MQEVVRPSIQQRVRLQITYHRLFVVMVAGGSYLKSLVPTFGGCVDKFLDELGLLADGKTQVPMKKHSYNAATDVISKVCVFVCVCVCA